MNKSEFIASYAENAGITKKESADQIETFIKTLQEGVIADGVLNLTNVFTISSKKVAAHEGRNPATSEPITIPEANRLYCSFGRGFKEAANAPKKTAKKTVAKAAPKAAPVAKKTVKKVIKKK